MKKLILAIMLAAPLAFAQQAPHAPQHPRVHPVPAPAVSSASPTDEHKEAAEEETGPADMKLWDTQIFNNKQPPYAALLFNFAILLLVYYRYGKKPVAEALKNRKTTIASSIENAQKILSEAKQRSKRYRAKLEKVAEDAEQGKQTQISTGKGEAELLIRAADEKAARIARDATFILDQEKKQTQIDLLKETVERAAKEAEALLHSNVSAADQERLAEEFLKQLETDYAAKGLG